MFFSIFLPFRLENIANIPRTSSFNRKILVIDSSSKLVGRNHHGNFTIAIALLPFCLVSAHRRCLFSHCAGAPSCPYRYTHVAILQFSMDALQGRSSKIIHSPCLLNFSSNFNPFSTNLPLSIPQKSPITFHFIHAFLSTTHTGSKSLRELC